MKFTSISLSELKDMREIAATMTALYPALFGVVEEDDGTDGEGETGGEEAGEKLD